MAIKQISIHGSHDLQAITSSLAHHPDAGLNPLVDAAASLFSTMGKLRVLKNCENFAQLHGELLSSIECFQETIAMSHYPEAYLAECIPVSCYALCMTLDEIILSTAWGGHGRWQPYSLVTAFNKTPLTSESFLIILERLIRDPNVYIDLMEFIYICLSLGASGKPHHDAVQFSYHQLEQILHSLYKRIRAHRGQFSKTLSPFPMQSANVQASPIYRSQKKIQLWKQIKNYLKSSKSNLTPVSRAKLNPLLNKSLDNLEKRLHGAIAFLRKNVSHVHGKKIQLHQLPWYLLLGKTGSGKTSLLAQSGVKYILNKKIKLEEIRHIASSENCDWWVTANAVLVDVPGSYIRYQPNVLYFGNKLWRRFLSLMVKLRGRTGLNGIIITLSFSELSDVGERNFLIENFRYRLAELEHCFGQLPVYLNITKCDLLPGFLEFFNDYSKEELAQVFGVSMPPLKQDDCQLEILRKRLHALIKRLNNQLIWRLHRERNPHRKSLIKDFPLQVEQLKDCLLDFVKRVTNDRPIRLQGVYLTSAIQPVGNPPLAITPSTELALVGEFQQALSILKIPDQSNQAYFIKQFILQALRR